MTTHAHNCATCPASRFCGSPTCNPSRAWECERCTKARRPLSDQRGYVLWDRLAGLLPVDLPHEAWQIIGELCARDAQASLKRSSRKAEREMRRALEGSESGDPTPASEAVRVGWRTYSTS